ncbi:MAG TPA: hypothetical protein VKU91_09160 [Acidimicrobiales bacterium]|nr:hypothetical protein [Acidimicrobiales bacterium]
MDAPRGTGRPIAGACLGGVSSGLGAAAVDDNVAPRTSLTVMSRWCRVEVLGPDGAPVASWPVDGARPPDMSAIDMLGRVVLGARAQGYRVVLTDICPELLELLDLIGLRRQMGGQSENGEDPLGVEEAVEPDDPAS